MLSYLLKNGNVTVYQWRYGEVPDQIQSPVTNGNETEDVGIDWGPDSAVLSRQDGGIDFGEIDFGGLELDVGGVITLEASGVADEGVALERGGVVTLEGGDVAALDMVTLEGGGVAGGVEDGQQSAAPAEKQEYSGKMIRNTALGRTSYSIVGRNWPLPSLLALIYAARSLSPSLLQLLSCSCCWRVRPHEMHSWTTCWS